MNEERFLTEYENLLDKGYCNCNEMNCIDNNSPRRILNIAKRLQQENQELKKQLEEKENQQKEFIEWLEKESKELIRDAGYHQRICLDILEKYKEIIGGKE